MCFCYLFIYFILVSWDLGYSISDQIFLLSSVRILEPARYIYIRIIFCCQKRFADFVLIFAFLKWEFLTVAGCYLEKSARTEPTRVLNMAIISRFGFLSDLLFSSPRYEASKPEIFSILVSNLFDNNIFPGFLFSCPLSKIIFFFLSLLIYLSSS